jgi:hypothetical protein
MTSLLFRVAAVRRTTVPRSLIDSLVGRVVDGSSRRRSATIDPRPRDWPLLTLQLAPAAWLGRICLCPFGIEAASDISTRSGFIGDEAASTGVPCMRTVAPAVRLRARPRNLPVAMDFEARASLSGVQESAKAFFAGDILERCANSSWSDHLTQVGPRSVRRVFRRHQSGLEVSSVSAMQLFCGLGDLAILVAAALQFVGCGLTRSSAIVVAP